MVYRCRIGSSGNLSSVSMSYFILLFLCLISYFYVLFHSCCSHVQVFLKTLVHEFHISYRYSHTEWNLLASLSANGDYIWKQSAVKLNSKLTCRVKYIILRQRNRKFAADTPLYPDRPHWQRVNPFNPVPSLKASCQHFAESWPISLFWELLLLLLSYGGSHGILH